LPSQQPYGNSVQLSDAARAAGVATGYHDIWGNWREAPASTLVAALDALGLAGAPDADALSRAVEQRRDADAHRLLPETIVLEAGQPTDVRLSRSGLDAVPGSPAQGAVGRIVWTVAQEDGSTMQGSQPLDAGDPLLSLPALPAGRHRLSVRVETGCGADGRPLPESPVAVILLCAPARCHLPPGLREGGRQWGIAVQLYGVRSERNWGIGDFSDLVVLVETAAALGASVVGLNPLHALPLDRPEQSSPYSAVSRLFLHPLYIDPERIDVFRDPSIVPALCARLAPESARAALRDAQRVDHAGVAALKLPVLRAIYDAFLRVECTAGAAGEGTPAGAAAAPGAWQDAFETFSRATDGLELHATYQSIQSALHAADASVWGWPCWPEALRDPSGDAVAWWRRDHAEDVGFHRFLEWQASRQWQQARASAAARGVLLYGDVALGADRGGSELWASRHAYALSMSAGCPPDDFNLQGQDWGLPPLRPDRLRADGCAAFRSVIAASMARFDALRLDHVMSLMRLFWIPPGPGPAAGAYVDYPFQAMLATLRIESTRHACMVIGEDLGTVPPAVREGLQGADVLSYRLLVFERDAPDHFRRPQDYPRLSLASIGSHDLSPLQGWWTGDDLLQRLKLGLLDQGQYDRFAGDRWQARHVLLAALVEAGLMPDGESRDASAHPLLPPRLVDAVHAFLARTASIWTMVNPEDVFDLVEATNLPGTTVEHPNWSRRLPVPVEAWSGHPRWQAIAETQRERATPGR
jgi:(1->4)-alpha-D-glucan 1-alpha-D-glucosylmutase